MLPRFAPAALAATASTSAFGAIARNIWRPPTITLPAYNTGSSGFNMAVAIGRAMKDKYGTDVRVLRAGKVVARRGPQKSCRAHPLARQLELAA